MEDLNVLAAHAAVIDGEVTAAAAPPEAGAAPGAVVSDPVTEARELIGFARTLFEPLYPALAEVYTPDACERLAQVSVPLMQKYGLTFSGLFEKWGAEINFAIVAAPLALSTAKVIKADNAARRSAAAGGGDGQGQQPRE